MTLKSYLTVSYELVISQERVRCKRLTFIALIFWKQLRYLYHNLRKGGNMSIMSGVLI